MVEEIFITAIKTFIMNYCIMFSTVKMMNINKKLIKNYKIVLYVNIFISIVYGIILEVINSDYMHMFLNFGIYLLYSTILNILLKIKFPKNIIGIVFSVSFAYIAIFISSMINFFIFNMEKLEIFKTGIIEYTVIGLIQFVIIYLFFNIKRFKFGFQFLKEEDDSKTNLTGYIIALLAITICIVYVVLDIIIYRILFCAIIILVAFLISIWIRKSITNYYKKRLKDRTVELQAEQLKEKDEKIAELQTELAGVLKINHKYNQRLSAMEDAVKKLGEKINFNEEFAKEYADVINSVNEFSKEYKQELAKINKDELPKTNIYSIDNLLEFLKKEANDANIKFKLQVNGNINEMIEGFIQKNKLETLLADHVRDAIIAIKSGNNEKREILLNLGKNGEFYEFCIQDTGIEFEIDTLLKLGKEQVTTHKDEGGSGIGFVTTFETIRECKASLIIKENHPQSRYTKAVMIRFDGKNEYRISSYRAIMIKDKNQDGRIIID